MPQREVTKNEKIFKILQKN